MEANSKDPFHSSLEISIQRPVYSQDSLNENFAYQRPIKKGCLHATKKRLAEECNSERLKKGLKARLPFIECLRNYSKDCIVGDVVAGLTVGIMQIPLGMAYALLGSCPAVTGLYTSFFPVLIYFFLGTSRHISQGTFAISSLLFAKTVDRLVTPLAVGSVGLSNVTNLTTLTSTTSLPDVGGNDTLTATQVVTSVCLIAGAIQVLLGIFRFGALSVYLSDTLISGFTTGAAVLVFTSQFYVFFSIKVPKYEMPFEIVKIYRYTFMNMGNANVASMIISAISLFVLAFTCEVINPIVMAKIKVPVPIELLAVVFGTAMSYCLGFKQNYGVKIVETIPSGMPMPTVPPVFRIFGDIIGDSIMIAIVTYVISFAVARLLAKKHNYDINANQEFMAMGVANFASSFFSCFPMCVALSRSMVLDGVGGKTQIAGLLSCGVVFIVLIAIAPLFECLPNCVLAAIIVVGIRRMFLQFRDLVYAWRISKLEGMTWIVTFLSVCLISIDLGLLIGVIFSLFTIILRSQRPYVTSLGFVKETELYLDVKKYSSAQEDPRIRIYHYGGPILFANSKGFRKWVYEISGVNPRLVLKKMEKLRNKRALKGKQPSSEVVIVDMSDAKAILDNERNSVMNPHGNLSGIRNPTYQSDDDLTSLKINNGSQQQAAADAEIIDQLNLKNRSNGSSSPAVLTVSVADEIPDADGNWVLRSEVIIRMKRGIAAIIIDGSAISCIDFSGVAALTQVIGEYEKVGITICLAALTGAVLDMLDSCDFYSRFNKNLVYPTVHDAMLHVGKCGYSDLPNSSTKL